MLVPDLEAIIMSRIQNEGRITFARFMDMALYYPGTGYYTSGRERIGASGDFYTSPTTHPTFAALIALQLEQMWHLASAPDAFTVVEMGAGKGLLARDIIAYLPYLSSGFTTSLRYITVEHDQTPVFIKPASGERVALENITGCLLSNEWLDAMPVHRVTVKNGRLRELYVSVVDGKLVEVSDELSTPELAERLRREGIRLPEGYTTEINLGVDRAMMQAGNMLDRGFVLTIDYGYTAPERYDPSRRRGTLMTAYRHQPGTDPYVHIGEQDITAHVDFTHVILAGEGPGLRREGLASQGEFLRNLGLDIFVEALATKRLPYPEYLANRSAMLELARPDGFGNFKVLVQSKNVAGGALYGLTARNDLRHRLQAVVESMPVPLLGPEHIPLARGRQAGEGRGPESRA